LEYSAIVDTVPSMVAPAVAPLVCAVLDRVARDLACGAQLDQVGPGDHRRWVQLAATDEYDAWLIAWPVGSGLPLHDHGGSSAAVHIVVGELEERHRTRFERTLRTRSLGVGDSITFGAEHVHALENMGAVEALSVHVYSPPLGVMAFYG
jgi:hypothetical protein